MWLREIGDDFIKFMNKRDGIKIIQFFTTISGPPCTIYSIVYEEFNYEMIEG